MTDTWYEKKVVEPKTLRNVGIDQTIWNAIGAKIHHSDIDDLSRILHVTNAILIPLLYAPCGAPCGILPSTLN